MKAAILFFVGLSVASATSAQTLPQPAGGDPRIQVVDYDPGQIVQLSGAPGYQLTVQLSPDEHVQNVAVGDSGAWQVSVNNQGDRLFLKPVQVDVPTNMTVITSVRVYNFELVPLYQPSPEMPYTVQFRYPSAEPGDSQTAYLDVTPALRRRSNYRVSGARLLTPNWVSDDGQRTYVSWAREKPIPAVYVIGDSGRESLANGMMRDDDLYVIDGVATRLIFRIDGQVARAERMKARKGR